MFTKAIRSRMLADSGIAALVGTKVYVDEAPQATDGADPYPYIVLRIVSDTPDHMLTGYSGITEFRVQADAYSRTSAEAKSIRNAVRNAFDGFKGTITVGSDSFEFQHIFLTNAVSFTESGDDGSEDGIRRVMMELSGMRREAAPALT